MESSVLAILIVLIAALVVLLGWSLYLTFVVFKHVREKKQLIKDVRTKGVRSLLEENMREVKRVDERLDELSKEADKLKDLANLGISRVGLMRYNPFQDTGSNQSFSVALLNSYGNGVVISSLHGRQETRVYSKPVIKGESEFNLTEDEKRAIDQAQGNNKKS